jgi:hypothetical protein
MGTSQAYGSYYLEMQGALMCCSKGLIIDDAYVNLKY